MNTRQRAGATGSAGHTGIGRNDTTVSSRVDDTVDSPTGTGGGRERPSPIVLPEVLRSAIDRFGDGLDWVRRNEDGGAVVYSPSADIFWKPEMWLRIEGGERKCFYGTEIFLALKEFCRAQH